MTARGEEAILEYVGFVQEAASGVSSAQHDADQLLLQFIDEFPDLTDEEFFERLTGLWAQLPRSSNPNVVNNFLNSGAFNVLKALVSKAAPPGPPHYAVPSAVVIDTHTDSTAASSIERQLQQRQEHGQQELPVPTEQCRQPSKQRDMRHVEEPVETGLQELQSPMPRAPRREPQSPSKSPPQQPPAIQAVGPPFSQPPPQQPRAIQPVGPPASPQQPRATQPVGPPPSQPPPQRSWNPFGASNLQPELLMPPGASPPPAPVQQTRQIQPPDRPPQRQSAVEPPVIPGLLLPGVSSSSCSKPDGKNRDVSVGDRFIARPFQPSRPASPSSQSRADTLVSFGALQDPPKDSLATLSSSSSGLIGPPSVQPSSHAPASSFALKAGSGTPGVPAHFAVPSFLDSDGDSDEPGHTPKPSGRSCSLFDPRPSADPPLAKLGDPLGSWSVPSSAPAPTDPPFMMGGPCKDWKVPNSAPEIMQPRSRGMENPWGSPGTPVMPNTAPPSVHAETRGSAQTMSNPRGSAETFQSDMSNPRGSAPTCPADLRGSAQTFMSDPRGSAQTLPYDSRGSAGAAFGECQFPNASLFGGAAASSSGAPASSSGGPTAAIRTSSEAASARARQLEQAATATPVNKDPYHAEVMRRIETPEEGKAVSLAERRALFEAKTGASAGNTPVGRSQSPAFGAVLAKTAAAAAFGAISDKTAPPAPPSTWAPGQGNATASKPSAFQVARTTGQRDDVPKPKALLMAEQARAKAKAEEERKQKEKQEREMERERAKQEPPAAAPKPKAKGRRRSAMMEVDCEVHEPQAANKWDAFFKSKKQALMKQAEAEEAAAALGTSGELLLTPREKKVHFQNDSKDEPWYQLRQVPLPPPVPEDDYELSDASDTEAEDYKEPDRSLKYVPEWAKTYVQHIKAMANVDADSVFGPVPHCNLNHIFTNENYAEAKAKRPDRKRGSSGNWSKDILCQAEIVVYKARLGQTQSWQAWQPATPVTTSEVGADEGGAGSSADGRGFQ